MHPIHHEIAKARIADLYRQAEQDAIAKAARQPRHAQTPQRHNPASGLAGRVLTLLAARNRPVPARSARLPTASTR